MATAATVTLDAGDKVKRVQWGVGEKSFHNGTAFVQNITGLMDKVQDARKRISESDYNQLSIRLELQADCYAGIWANHSQQARQWLDTDKVDAIVDVPTSSVARGTSGGAAPGARRTRTAGRSPRS